MANPDNTASYAQRLRLASRFAQKARQEAIESLRITPASEGLDAGCGIGQYLPWLAEMVGPGGRVTGLDNNPDLLEVAGADADKSGIASRLSFRQADINQMPFADDSFDWAICADVLWTVPAEKGAAAAGRSAPGELCRVVRPGGQVALLFWCGQSLLAGYPELEARLNAAHTRTNPYLAGVAPGQHFMRALGWLRSAGLEQTEVRCYASEAHGPLDTQLKESLSMCFGMFWDDVKPHVSGEDWNEYQRLCRPESADFILNERDYFCFVVYALFCGRVPGR